MQTILETAAADAESCGLGLQAQILDYLANHIKSPDFAETIAKHLLDAARAYRNA